MRDYTLEQKEFAETFAKFKAANDKKLAELEAKAKSPTPTEGEET